MITFHVIAKNVKIDENLRPIDEIGKDRLIQFLCGHLSFRIPFCSGWRSWSDTSDSVWCRINYWVLVNLRMINKSVNPWIHTYLLVTGLLGCAVFLPRYFMVCIDWFLLCLVVLWATTTPRSLDIIVISICPDWFFICFFFGEGLNLSRWQGWKLCMLFGLTHKILRQRKSSHAPK